MPAAFDACRKAGGRIRTISGGTKQGKQMGLSSDEYVHVCIDKSGNMHRGYVKKKTLEKETSKEND